MFESNFAGVYNFTGLVGITAKTKFNIIYEARKYNKL